MTIVLNDDPGRCISDHDLAVLSEWANKQKHLTQASEFKKPFAMIREACDLMLRYRARVEEKVR